MIYFLRHKATGKIKIGKSKHFDTRWMLLTRRYGALEILGFMEGHSNKERELHDKFSQYNVRGVLEGNEWFNPENDLIQFISANSSIQIQAHTETPYMGKSKPRVDTQRPKRLVSNLPTILQEYRREKGLTQEDLAALVRNALKDRGMDGSKFDATFVSRIENNKDATRIDLGTLDKLRLVIPTINFGNIAVEIDQ